MFRLLRVSFLSFLLFFPSFFVKVVNLFEDVLLSKAIIEFLKISVEDKWEQVFDFLENSDDVVIDYEDGNPENQVVISYSEEDGIIGH